MDDPQSNNPKLTSKMIVTELNQKVGDMKVYKRVLWKLMSLQSEISGSKVIWHSVLETWFPEIKLELFWMVYSNKKANPEGLACEFGSMNIQALLA